jgi:hypothetical protein
VRNPSVAKEVAEEQERLMDPALSWRLELHKVRVAWRDLSHGAPRLRHAEPEASWRRTLVAWAARVLPVEEQL